MTEMHSFHLTFGGMFLLGSGAQVEEDMEAATVETSTNHQIAMVQAPRSPIKSDILNV